MNVYCLLFDEYETLDLMGPVGFLHRIPDVRLHYVSQKGGMVRSRQGFAVETDSLEGLLPNSVLLLPGGQGTRQLAHCPAFLNNLASWAEQAETCLAVCTGSALLAAAGRLDGVAATSNKRVFEWVKSIRPEVKWQPVARWVCDGKFYTSSGVSAGMDMALGFIADRYGIEQAEEIAVHTEYVWQKDPAIDVFAAVYGYGG